MSSEPNEPQSSQAAKQSIYISIPFLVIAAIILLVGLFQGKNIMTWVMYQMEENKKAKTPFIEKENPHERPENLMFGDGAGPGAQEPDSSISNPDEPKGTENDDEPESPEADGDSADDA